MRSEGWALCASSMLFLMPGCHGPRGYEAYQKHGYPTGTMSHHGHASPVRARDAERPATNAPTPPAPSAPSPSDQSSGDVQSLPPETFLGSMQPQGEHPYVRSLENFQVDAFPVYRRYCFSIVVRLKPGAVFDHADYDAWFESPSVAKNVAGGRASKKTRWITTHPFCPAETGFLSLKFVDSFFRKKSRNGVGNIEVQLWRREALPSEVPARPRFVPRPRAPHPPPMPLPQPPTKPQPDEEWI